MRTSCLGFLVAISAAFLPACTDSSGGGASDSAGSGASAENDSESSGGGAGENVPELGFILGQSVFSAKNVPLPSQFVIAQRHSDGSWTSETVVDEGGGNVFHKAMWFEPVHGDPGILTISANDPFVKIWRRNGGDWKAETLWSGTIGDKQNRLRDVEVGDVTGDGVDDIVIVTHDQGVVFLLEQKDGSYPETRIDEPGEQWWIHEVELGDVDGDGVTEIFCTPSAPNNLEGKEQPGAIKMFKLVDGAWQSTVLENFSTRHVKEVLCTDYFGTGRPVLFASIEGETIGAAGGGGSALKLYQWPEGGEMTSEEVSSIPGKLTRFLQCGDTNGDGVNEIVAATMSHGIVSMWYDEKTEKWTKKNVISSLVSSSFEHAIWLRDLDGDGIEDVIAASDKQKRLQVFTWNPERARYEREKLLNLDGEAIFTFNMTTFDGKL